MSFQAWSADGKRVVIVERETVKPDALFDDWQQTLYKRAFKKRRDAVKAGVAPRSQTRR